MSVNYKAFLGFGFEAEFPVFRKIKIEGKTSWCGSPLLENEEIDPSDLLDEGWDKIKNNWPTIRRNPFTIAYPYYDNNTSFLLVHFIYSSEDDQIKTIELDTESPWKALLVDFCSAVDIKFKEPEWILGLIID